MVDLLLVGVRLRITLANTLRNDARVALRVAGVLAVLALHPGGVLEELATERAAHNVVELLLDELVAVHLVDVLLALADGSLSPQPEVDGPAVLVRLDEAQGQLDPPAGLQVEPGLDRPSGDGGKGTGGLRGTWLGPRSPGSHLLPWRRGVTRVHRELRRRSAALHRIGRYPARVVGLRLDPLPAHLLHNVGYSDP